MHYFFLIYSSYIFFPSFMEQCKKKKSFTGEEFTLYHKSIKVKYILSS